MEALTSNIHMDCVQDGYQQPFHPEFRYNGALPHLKVLEEVGHQLKELCIFSIEDHKVENVVESEDEEWINMATGLYMEHLLKHCPNLTHLVIRNTKLLTMGSLCAEENSIINTSIQDLNLEE